MMLSVGEALFRSTARRCGNCLWFDDEFLAWRCGPIEIAGAMISIPVEPTVTGLSVPMKRVLIFVASLCVCSVVGGEGPSADERERRVVAVCGTPGLVAFWDFVLRDPESGQFAAYQPDGSAHDFRLEATNYVRDYWGEGRAASYDDFPLLDRGPFGQAIRIRRESDPAFRPCLLVSRERLHDTGLDVKGLDASVSMVAWIIRESGNHAVAGIWHEGTDLRSSKGTVVRQRRRHRDRLFGRTGDRALDRGPRDGSLF